MWFASETPEDIAAFRQAFQLTELHDERMRKISSEQETTAAAALEDAEDQLGTRDDETAALEGRAPAEQQQLADLSVRAQRMLVAR